MLLAFFLLLLGFAALIYGANWLVDGATALAKKFGVPEIIIGLTVISFGTSAPELVVNALAAGEGHADIVYGNVIGSNICNLFLVLGVVGVLAPLQVPRNTVWKEIPISFAAIVALYLLGNNLITDAGGVLTRIDGLVLLAMFAGTMYYLFNQIKSGNNKVEIEVHSYSGGKITLLIIGGLATLLLGGKLVVDNAVHIATTLGMSEEMIALTVVALGTSLPELVTSAVAASKKQNDLALGNIVGSNIFNILLILPISSFIQPLPYNSIFNRDLFFLAAGTILLFVLAIASKAAIKRGYAAIFLLGYITYMIFIIVNEL